MKRASKLDDARNIKRVPGTAVETPKLNHSLGSTCNVRVVNVATQPYPFGLSTSSQRDSHTTPQVRSNVSVAANISLLIRM